MNVQKITKRFLVILLAFYTGVFTLTPVRAAPDSQIEVYGDWSVRCAQRQDAPPCDIMQSAEDNRTGGRRVIQFSVAYDGGVKDIYGIQIKLPLGTALQAGVLIRIDDSFDIDDLTFSHCDMSGCYAEKTTPPDGLSSFVTSEEGVLVFMDHSIRSRRIIPLSFVGFNDALQVMSDRNKLWAEAR